VGHALQLEHSPHHTREQAAATSKSALTTMVNRSVQHDHATARPSGLELIDQRVDWAVAAAQALFLFVVGVKVEQGVQQNVDDQWRDEQEQGVGWREVKGGRQRTARRLRIDL